MPDPKTDFSTFAADLKKQLAERTGKETPERLRHLGLMEETCDEVAKRLDHAKTAADAVAAVNKLHSEFLKKPLKNEADDSARSEPLGPIANAIHNTHIAE
jgi:glucan phosphorylase